MADLRKGRTDRRAFRPGEAAGALFRVGGPPDIGARSGAPAGTVVAKPTDGLAHCLGGSRSTKSLFT